MEASLDVILKERLVVVDDEEEDEDDEEISDGDERGESPLRVLPKQPGEFVCQSLLSREASEPVGRPGRDAVPRLRLSPATPRRAYAGSRSTSEPVFTR